MYTLHTHTYIHTQLHLMICCTAQRWPRGRRGRSPLLSASPTPLKGLTEISLPSLKA